MQIDLLERLNEAREKLRDLKSVQCQMAHERVLIDRDSNLPVAGIVPDMEFKRRSLCAAAKRNANLACSHTMARYPIEDALDVLEQIVDCRDWRVQLKEINTEIYALDRRKSDAEIRAAQIIKELREAFENGERELLEEKSMVSEQISEIERLHNICAEKIEKLKNDVFDALTSAIENGKN